MRQSAGTKATKEARLLIAAACWHIASRAVALHNVWGSGQPLRGPRGGAGGVSLRSSSRRRAVRGSSSGGAVRSGGSCCRAWIVWCASSCPRRGESVCGPRRRHPVRSRARRFLWTDARAIARDRASRVSICFPEKGQTTGQKPFTASRALVRPRFTLLYFTYFTKVSKVK